MADIEPTLVYDEVEENAEAAKDGVWGRLTSLNPNHPHIDLMDGMVTFGRATICSHTFDVNLISGNHCKITRDEHAIYIEDLS